MPSIRIGLSTQFNLENERVGIGTTNPTEFLEVIGNIKAEGAAGGSGVSTFREYQGFHQSEQGIANNIVITARLINLGKNQYPSEGFPAVMREFKEGFTGYIESRKWWQFWK